MTLRHMTIFRAVCEAGFSTTGAAERLHMSQPAVSLAIKELEQYYGLRLFDRIGRRLRITDAGRQFLQYAIHISDLFEDMETGLRNWGSKGILRVGASVTIGSRFMPAYVKAFSARCPGIDVRVVVDQTDRLEKKLLENELDFALTEGLCHDPAILSEAYMEDRLCVVCPGDGPWKQGQILTKDEFRQQRFLLREQGSGTREVFDRAMARAGISISPAWESISTTALVNGVISGLGITVLSGRLILSPLERGLIVSAEVEDISFLRSFYIIHHKNKFLTGPAGEFMALCRNFEAEQPTPEYPGLF